jgi:hypothetical protein
LNAACVALRRRRDDAMKTVGGNLQIGERRDRREREAERCAREE